MEKILSKPEVLKTLERQFDSHFIEANAAGNLIGLFNATGFKGIKLPDILGDKKLRQKLVTKGVEDKRDTIMILVGSPTEVGKNGFHFETAIFEPNGIGEDGEPGGESTMCGNGTRVVGAAATLLGVPQNASTIVLKTKSGLLDIERDEQQQYTVRMGQLTHNVDHLQRYVNTEVVPANESGSYFNAAPPEGIINLFHQYGIEIQSWSIGLTSAEKDSAKIDGEPHVVINLGNNLDPELIYRIALEVGPQITKNRELFPQEINVNFIGNIHVKDGKVIFDEVTHERNLGEDPVKSITASCGTGTTVAVGSILQTLNEPTISHGKAVCRGGELEIIRGGGKKNVLYLKGPAIITNGHAVETTPQEQLHFFPFSIGDIEALATYQPVTATDMVISAVKAGGIALVDQHGRAYVAWTTHDGTLVSSKADYTELDQNLPHERVVNVRDLNGDYQYASDVIDNPELAQKLAVTPKPDLGRIYFKGKDGHDYYNGPVRRDDYDAMREIMKETFHFDGPSDEILDLIISIGGIVSGTFDERGTMVGFNTLIPTLDRTTQRTGYLLDMIGIMDKYQDMGLGSGSLNAIIYHALNLGLDEISLTVDPKNTRAIRAYQKARFTGTYMMENLYGLDNEGEATDRLLMQLNLK